MRIVWKSVCELSPFESKALVKCPASQGVTREAALSPNMSTPAKSKVVL